MRWKTRPPRHLVWHQWFAWHPVRLEDTGEIAWFETVFRWKEVMGGWGDYYTDYRYRLDWQAVMKPESN